MGEEKPKTDDADEQDRHGQISAVEELVERPAVGSDHTLNKVAGPLFHPGPLVTRLAFAEDSRAHQGRESQ